MDISLQSLLFFTIITIIYFAFPSIGKPQLTLDHLIDEQSKANYYTQNMKSLAFYLGVIVFTQLVLNIGYLMAKCGGSLDKNIGAAAVFTIIPWVLIFGVMIAVLIIFPGFKTAFSDVIGYFVVAGGANEIFGEKTNKKKELTNSLVSVMKNNSIDCFDINGGSLVYKQRKTKKTITGKYLLSQLEEYYKEQPELAREITKKVLDNRIQVVKDEITRKIEKQK